MLNRAFPLFLIYLLAAPPAVPPPAIAWKQAVVIHDIPPFTDAGKVYHADGTWNREHGKYGSEYGRMVKVAGNTWLAAYTISRNNGYLYDPKGGLELQVSKSTDNGRTWAAIATLTDPGRDLDNAQLIQLPDGSILLGCRSVRWQESYRLPVYRSTDNGMHWAKLSTIDANEGTPGSLGKPDKGMYEPHFYLLDNGKLAVMYANEKHVTEQPAYSQIISQKVSDDLGATWGTEIWVAYEPGHNASRPGMPVWTKMKNGQFIVVFEVCGPEKCNVYYKTSPDGTTWPVGLGTQIPDQLGGPYILSLTDGRLVITSNRSNISISTDYGLTWQKTTAAWPSSLWASLYQTGPDEIVALNSVPRPSGGHNVQLKFGTVESVP